jgi:hypothetical protein
MAEEPENFVLAYLREFRAALGQDAAALDRKLDAVLEELHDLRAEAAADRARTAGIDPRSRPSSAGSCAPTSGWPTWSGRWPR